MIPLLLSQCTFFLNGCVMRVMRVIVMVVAVAMLLGQAGAQEAPMAKPMMVSEAKLPKGFPSPGPIGEVIVKTYPAHRLARVKLAGEKNDTHKRDGKNSGGSDNGMFMQLFRHISRNDISMTAPVEMVWTADPLAPLDGTTVPDASQNKPQSMAFLYGNETIGTPGTDPQDPRVVVEDIPETKVLSIGLRGGYGTSTLDRGLEKLRAWLAMHPEWTAAAAPRTLGYNSPFVPNILKYSEVQIPIAPVAAPGPPHPGQ